MTKQDILNTTGLSEEEFYQRYPDQETFCSDYPEMCPDMMDDEDVSDEYVVESDYDDSLYEAEDGVETTAPYTDYNQYKNAMQTYGAESNKAATYNSFQNDLYNQSGKTRGSSETASQLGDMFNTLSPEQQDALAQKYGAQFITNTPSANRRNYVNSMEMTVPGKGTGYYSFPTNDVVYGSKNLERPNYEFPAMTMAPYKMPAAPKKFSIEPTQLINSISAGYKNPAALNLNNGNLPIPKYSLSRTMEKVGATNQPFVTSTPSYSSIIDLLKARKQDSSFANRKKLAEEAGIKNYTGSASQNMDLINRMDNFNPYSTEMELGGVNIHPAMRTNFKQGGYYGMDGKLHKAKGSGTYVMNGGYYFEPGGTSTAPPVASPDTPPGAMGDPAAVPQSSLNYNMPNPDGTFNVNNDYNYGNDMEDNSADDGSYQSQSARAQRRQARRNAPYETPDLGGLDESQFEEQPEEEVTAEPFDASNYSSAIDPSTGFVTYAKNNKTLTNIKKQDPALWQQLKDEGKGARFRTGQTDIQKVGRAAGRLANNLEMGVNIANAAGQLLNNKFQQRSLNNAAINKGSTASMYTNPQSASKGDFGQTGSSYGMTDPTSVGARSFKGMYGKYGMEVPTYDVGGGFSNLFTSAQSVIPISNPISLMPSSVSFTGNSGFNPFQTNMPIIESTGVYRNNREVTDNQENSNTPIVNKRGGTDVATRLNNPRNLIYNPVFSKLFGAKKSSTKQTDGSGYFAEFPSIEAGLKAAETQLFGETDGIFKSNYYNPDTDINKALKTWSGGGYGVEIYPEIKGKTLSQITAAERRELQRRQIKRESGAMYKVLEENGVFNNTNKTNNYAPSSNYAPSNTNFSLKNLIDFAKTNNWAVTSTTGGRHNPGSRHGKARAIDVSVKNKTPQQISDFMKLAQSQGYRVLDERVRPKGQKVWHGAHLHLDFEKGGQFGGQVMEMDENEIKQFLKAGGQLEFLD